MIIRNILFTTIDKSSNEPAELIKFPSNKNVIGTLGWSNNVLHAGSHKFSVFDRFQDSTIRMQ